MCSIVARQGAFFVLLPSCFLLYRKKKKGSKIRGKSPYNREGYQM